MFLFSRCLSYHTGENFNPDLRKMYQKISGQGKHIDVIKTLSATLKSDTVMDEADEINIENAIKEKTLTVLRYMRKTEDILALADIIPERLFQETLAELTPEDYLRLEKII